MTPYYLFRGHDSVVIICAHTNQILARIYCGRFSVYHGYYAGPCDVIPQWDDLFVFDEEG